MTNGSLFWTRSSRKSASEKDNTGLVIEVTCEQDSLTSQVLFLFSRPFKGTLEYALDYGIVVVPLYANLGSGEKISVPGS
jgi:hypothetical protein